MPKNNSLSPKQFPMPVRFNEEPQTTFKNALEAIKVTLVQAPDFDDLKKYCVPFANATWADDPMSFNDSIDDTTQDLIMHKIFTNKILPTTMEAIRCNFVIQGIGMQEVSHILRYRRAVFSAECSGDKWWSHKDALVPTAVENTPEFYERWKNLVLEAKKLYTDMIDSKLITIHDARNIFPRCLETYYFMSMSLKDTLLFLFDRVDKQIQPVTDNVIAYRMMTALVEKYPLLVKTLNTKYLHQPAKFYVATARQNRSTNFYPPDKDSDVFEWNEQDFVYNRPRDEINGLNNERDVFADILKETEEVLDRIEAEVNQKYPEGFFNKDVPAFC